MSFTLGLVTVSNKAHNLSALIQWARQSGLFDQIIAIADADANDPELNKVAQLADIYEILPVKGYAETVLNHASSLVQTDWILCLACDERLGSWAKQQLFTLLDSKIDYYWLPRYWLWKDSRHYVVTHYPDWQLRLYRRGHVTYMPQIHASPRGDGEQGFALCHIFHFDLLWSTTEERIRKMQAYENIASKPLPFQAIYYNPINPPIESCIEQLDWNITTTQF